MLKNRKIIKLGFAIAAISLLASFSNAQDAWTKIKIEGEITYHSFPTTKKFDDDGKIIAQTQTESNGSTHQIFTFYRGRF